MEYYERKEKQVELQKKMYVSQHYENLPMQYTWIFFCCKKKKKKFNNKNFDIVN